MHWLTMVGILLNAAMITAHRFWRKMPEWLYMAGLVIGVMALVAGLSLHKQ